MFQARRVSSQDWGHKEATKPPAPIYIQATWLGSLTKAGTSELDEEKFLPSHLPRPRVLTSRRSSVEDTVYRRMS